MISDVRCECGKAHTVSATDAGATLKCACGREVDVPPLHVLRETAGEFGLSPDLMLQGLILKKQLPDTDECAQCGTKTEGEVVAVVNCESAQEKEVGAAATGCVATPFFAIVSYLPSRKRTLGRDVWFRVPVRCCPACARTLTGDGLRTLLRKNRVCAGVLDKYPHARVTRAG